MIVISDKKTIIINTEKITHFNIHQDGKKIMASFGIVGNPSMTIGSYENKKQTERAFGILINAFKEMKEVFEMPNSADARLNTNGYYNGRTNTMGYKCVGKTK